MKIPEEIKIGGLTMQIIEDKNLAASEDRFGECDHMRGRIVIDANQPQDHKEVTLIHEIIEKINLEHELKLEHNQITSLASCFHQVIKDNFCYDFKESKTTVTNYDIPIIANLTKPDITKLTEYIRGNLALSLKSII